MKITFVTNYPSLDIKNWSGLEYFIVKALENEGHQIDIIANLEDKWNFSFKIKNKIYGRKGKGQYIFNRSPEGGREYARQIKERLNNNTDIIFTASSIPISYLETKIPKVFYTDATFASMLGYYDWFSSLNKQTIKEGTKMEEKALDTCRLALYASEWAANSAIKDYSANPQKVKVIPFGANITNRPTFEEVNNIFSKREKNHCHITFMGVEWQRKGADIVLEAVKYLNDVLMLPVTLHFIGMNELSTDNIPSYIINHGYISKKNKEGQKQIENILYNSHFLFVPSRAEAYGLVFCEAMAYGVIPVSANTGGIPSIIKNNENGILLNQGCTPTEYAERIYELFTDKKRFEEICLAAFNDFETRLNWDVAGKKITEYLNEIIK